MELLEPLLLPPARRLEEDEVRRRRFAAALARSGDVVMQPGSGREAERGGREFVAEASLDEHDLLAQPLGERLPVVGREEVEVVGSEPAHRPLVEGREPGEARRRFTHRDLETGRPCLAHLVAVLGMKAVEEVEVGVERPGDGVGQPLDVDAVGRLPLVGEQRMKADEGGDDARRAAPAVVELIEVFDRRLRANGHRTAVTVRRGRIQQASFALDLPQDQGEDDIAAVCRQVE